jgi:hypothetical protein
MRSLWLCFLLVLVGCSEPQKSWNFAYETVFPDLGDTTNDIAVADIDGDGKLDIVTDKYLYWFKNPGVRGVDWERHPISGDSGDDWWLGHWTGDFDGDGDQDVVSGQCANTNTYWFENVNGDGYTDLFHSSEEDKGIWYFIGPADPKISDWKMYTLDPDRTHDHTCWLTDFDLDGDLDFLTAQMHQSEEDRVAIFENSDGTGVSWTEHIIGTTGSHNAITGDIDGDGRPDVIGKNWSQLNPIQIWYNEIQ